MPPESRKDGLTNCCECTAKAPNSERWADATGHRERSAPLRVPEGRLRTVQRRLGVCGFEGHRRARAIRCRETWLFFLELGGGIGGSSKWRGEDPAITHNRWLLQVGDHEFAFATSSMKEFRRLGGTPARAGPSPWRVQPRRERLLYRGWAQSVLRGSGSPHLRSSVQMVLVR